MPLGEDGDNLAARFIREGEQQLPLGPDVSFLQRSNWGRSWGGCGCILLSSHTWLWARKAKGKMLWVTFIASVKGGVRQRNSPSKASKALKSHNLAATSPLLCGSVRSWQHFWFLLLPQPGYRIAPMIMTRRYLACSHVRILPWTHPVSAQQIATT